MHLHRKEQRRKPPPWARKNHGTARCYRCYSLLAQRAVAAMASAMLSASATEPPNLKDQRK